MAIGDIETPTTLYSNLMKLIKRICNQTNVNDGMQTNKERDAYFANPNVVLVGPVAYGSILVALTRAARNLLYPQEAPLHTATIVTKRDSFGTPEPRSHIAVPSLPENPKFYIVDEQMSAQRGRTYSNVVCTLNEIFDEPEILPR